MVSLHIVSTNHKSNISHMQTVSFKQHNNFDFIRLVLAMLVIITHTYVNYYGNLNFEPFWIFSHQRISLGNIAVGYFFLISGYMIAQSWFRSGNALSFLYKRALRVYPAFAWVTLVTALLFVPLGNQLYHSSIVAYGKYLHTVDFNYLPQTVIRLKEPFLPASFLKNPMPNEVNYSLWTIQHEFICYLVLMFLGILKIIRFKWIILGVALLSILCLGYFQFGNTLWISNKIKPENFSILFGLTLLLPFFLAGVCYYHFEKYFPKKKSWAILCLLIMILSARYTNAFLFFQMTLGSYFIFWFAYNKKFTFKWPTHYGDFSYGVYLFGCPIQQVLIYYFGASLNFYLVLTLSYLFVIPFAVFSWFIIEKPFLKLKNVSLTFSTVKALLKI